MIIGTVRGATVRPWRQGDAESIAIHANNRKIWRNLRDAFPHPYTRDDADRYLALVGGRDPVINFAIEVDGAAAGSIGFKPGTDVERVQAELGYWLGEGYWGRGIMSEVVAMVTAWGLDRLGWLRVFAVPFAWNQASCRVLEKAGYTLEGRLRKSAIKDGVVVDQLLYAKVREG